jgi:hypothetical protein
MNTTKKIKNLRKETENYQGVYLDITKLKENSQRVFRAKFQRNGVTYSLGYHLTALEAAKAVNKKAKVLFKSEKNAKKAGIWNLV